MQGRDAARGGVLAGLMLATLAAAGCSDAPDPVEADGGLMDLLATALVEHDDHSGRVAHPAAWHGMQESWETTLPMEGGAVSPPSEFSVWGHYAFVSLFHPSAGFAVLDISDIEHPAHVAYYDAGTAYTNDVEVSPDGRWAFVPTQPYPTGENDPLAGGLPKAGDYGIQAVDLLDISAPSLASVWVDPFPLSEGYHRLDVEEIGGELYVAAANSRWARVDILRFEPAPAPHFEPVSIYQDPRGAADPMEGTKPGYDSYSVHDVTFIPDPLEAFPLLAVAHWRAGAHFVDMSDPDNPRKLGHWDGFTDVLPGNVHNVEVAAVEGRRLAFVVPEYPITHERQGILWIVDVTDFGNPVQIGNWSLPGLHPVQGGTYVWSSDRVEVRNGTAFLAHFHAGAIVLDVSTLELAREPELVAFGIPEGEAAIPYMGFTTNPLIYDVVPYGRHVLMSDLSGGFTAARLEVGVLPDRQW